MEQLRRREEAAGIDELPHRLPRRNNGELVPWLGYGACQRRGSERRERAWRLSCHPEEDAAVVLAYFRLLSAFARRTGDYPVERLHQGDSEELDWSFRRH